MKVGSGCSGPWSCLGCGFRGYVSDGCSDSEEEEAGLPGDSASQHDSWGKAEPNQSRAAPEDLCGGNHSLFAWRPLAAGRHRSSLLDVACAVSPQRKPQITLQLAFHFAPAGMFKRAGCSLLVALEGSRYFNFSKDYVSVCFMPLRSIHVFLEWWWGARSAGIKPHSVCNFWNIFLDYNWCWEKETLWKFYQWSASPPMIG